jgi:putative ABC transport system permease protein
MVKSSTSRRLRAGPPAPARSCKGAVMFFYYLKLALRSLGRNVVLTVLMVAAIGVGIGASMTTVTIFRAMDADPVPAKSGQLFAPQIDNFGPANQKVVLGDEEHLQEQISYTDAVNLMNAHAAARQAAMYVTQVALTPPNRDLLPFQVQTRATYTDFFKMFEVPFLYGGQWNASDDADRAYIAVLSRELNDRVFGGMNSVGRTLDLDNHEYRVVGVLDRWQPLPKFYDLTTSKYGEGEQIYVPFSRAIESHMENRESSNCAGDVGATGWDGFVHSECVWIQFWMELPTQADVARYRAFLNNYAADQQRAGRFDWPPRTRLLDVRDWLAHWHAVSDEVRILVLVAFSFLFVCLLNAMGLMLAKIMNRAGDIGVRRALGANRSTIFSQCLIEAGVVGLAGGLLGLVLTALGLAGVRLIVSQDIARLAHFSLADIAIALGLAVCATTLAGLYPTWRAAHVQPAWQLKAQ